MIGWLHDSKIIDNIPVKDGQLAIIYKHSITWYYIYIYIVDNDI